MEAIETIESACGSYRAVVLPDCSPMEAPDYDGCGTVLHQDDGGRVDLLTEECGLDTRMRNAYTDLWERFHDFDTIEGVLRGRLYICVDCHLLIENKGGRWVDETGGDVCSAEYNPVTGAYEDVKHEPTRRFANNPVVGFDVRELRHGRLVNIVTLADLQAWGFDSVYEFNQAMVKAYGYIVDPSFHNLDDFEAWVNGEVYFVALERNVKTYTIVAFKGQVTSRGAGEEWEEVESLGGFYSLESALDQARDFIDSVD